MAERREYFVEGAEKFLHFSTGLMFAISAAAIQSAKLNNALLLQVFFELGSWILILFAAIFGVYTSLSHSVELDTLDKYKINEEIFEKSVSRYQEKMKEALANSKSDPLAAMRLKQEEDNMYNDLRRSLMDDMTKNWDQFERAKRRIISRNKLQFWIFACGLGFLAIARATPVFTHQKQGTRFIDVSVSE